MFTKPCLRYSLSRSCADETCHLFGLRQVEMGRGMGQSGRDARAAHANGLRPSADGQSSSATCESFGRAGKRPTGTSRVSSGVLDSLPQALLLVGRAVSEEQSSAFARPAEAIFEAAFSVKPRGSAKLFAFQPRPAPLPRVCCPSAFSGRPA